MRCQVPGSAPRSPWQYGIPKLFFTLAAFIEVVQMFVSRLMVQAMLAELQGRGLKPNNLVPDFTPLQGEQLPTAPGLRGRDMELLVERAVRQSGDQSLGLTMGQRTPETMLHVLGHLLLTCSTVREAFEVLQQYANLMFGGIEWYLAERGPVASSASPSPTYPTRPLASGATGCWPSPCAWVASTPVTQGCAERSAPGPLGS